MEFQESNLNFEYCRASSGKRLANYVIDLVAFYIIIFFLATLTEILVPGSVNEMDDNPIADRLITLVLYGLIMFVIEAAFQGKSLGKFITGTKAVRRDGATLTFTQFLIRNFIRAIPFNAFSAFGNPCSPWHDSLSDTLVVDEKVWDLEKRKDKFYTDLKNQKQ